MAIPNSSEILQAVIDATPDAIFVKDLEGRYVLVNAAMARFLGKPADAVVGRNDCELYPADTARRFIDDDRKVIASGRAQSFEGVATVEDGSSQAYLVTKGVYRNPQGEIVGVFGISHDVTELREAQKTLEQTREALFRSQKMEAVGQLTGGIADDFNNILAVIIGNVELLRAYFPKDKYAGEIVSAVLKAALHGRDLTSHLLAFSRRRLLNPQAVDVHALVANTVKLLGRTLGATIRLDADTRAASGIAFVDPAALEAAVLNIALNARDAMPDGGSLTFRTTALDVPEARATEFDVPPGSYLALAIEDTGTGMTPDVVARVFEPFFTTKTGGAGTGLGLSMVYGFAKQSGGSVTITSEPGRGTTVTLYLPVAGKQSPSETIADEAVTRSATPRVVLVVEDEAEVRNIVRRQLESLGHRVLVAEAATEALLLLQGRGAPELLLTDVVLASGMDGIELAEAARAERPRLPVIFMSGYTAVPEAQQRIRETGAPLLAKPFTTQELERAIAVVCQPA
ncbi:MAG TPA: PAS domain-containing protein [Vicinamibacterales bacterium]|nr:PAS domain-containing protein [Vicinamibacterales bacterium]